MQNARAPYAKPAVEKLLDHELADATWPTLSGLPGFRLQLGAQRFALESFRSTMARLPVGTSLAPAVESGSLDVGSASALYWGLTEYLEREPAHSRLALFLPFELTTPVSPEVSAELAEADRRFQRAYRNAFERLLREHEVRANFTDGDVLEAELRDGDHPRVVKATHLVPGLIAAGHLSVTEAKDYHERSTDPLLRAGITDALAAYAESTRPKKATDGQTFSFSSIARELSDEFTRIAAWNPSDSTPARAAWLKLDAREQAISLAASHVARRLKLGSTLPEPTGLSAPLLTACVDGLRQAALRIPRIYERHSDWLATLRRRQADSVLADAIVKLHAHLHAVGTVGDETLKMWNITLPNLSGPLSDNLTPLAGFLREVEVMCERIGAHPFLGGHVLPVTLVFGSQLKGYGRTNADADVAVFVKPGVDRSERERIEAELAGIFSHEKIGGKAVLFWLEEQVDGLAVIDWPDFTHSDGESSWIHVLFGAAWTGDVGCIMRLHRTLLTRYFKDPGTKLYGKPTRERWLEEMERDTVLYRLLHKGYERYFPIQSPYAGATAIDGDSAFYDPRFRRFATELYLGRVFLPLVT
jgi:hypothetical protein